MLQLGLESQNIDYTAHLESIPSGSLHPDVDAPLTGVSIVDVGCGAGILAEHLAYLGKLSFQCFVLENM